MNQSKNDSTKQPEVTTVKTPHRSFGFFFYFVVFVVLGAIATGIALRPNSLLEWQNKPVVSSVVQSPGQNDVMETPTVSADTDIEQKLSQLETRVNELMSRLDKLEQEPAPSGIALSEAAPAAPSAPAGPSVEEVTRLKNEVINLSAALSAVQLQLKQSVQSADQTRSAAQTEVAAAVAFAQLRAVTSTGAGFAREVQMIRQAAENDAVVRENLAILDPLAENGAPSIAALREEWTTLKGAAQSALRRAEAQTWKDRVLAELKGLINIRPAHSEAGQEDQLGLIDKDLASYHLGAALEKVKALPESAQKIVKDWRSKAEARQNIDMAMNALAARLTERSRIAETPAAVPTTQPAATTPMTPVP